VLSEETLDDAVIPGNGYISLFAHAATNVFCFISNNINIQISKKFQDAGCVAKVRLYNWFCEAACCGLV